MLFGHQNDDTSQAAQTTTVEPQTTGVNPLAVDPETGASLPTAPPAPKTPAADSDEPSVLNQPSSSDTPADTPMPAAPALPLPPAPDPEPEPKPAIPEPIAASDPAPTELPQPVATPAPAASPTLPSAEPASDDLLSIKQHALEQLEPLVDQLDQTPEEKFRTTMMLIQSTDNPAHIPDAYEAAQAIGDEKARAQALLDVINEINYFTQKSAN